MTEYIPEVVVADLCSVFFGAKRYTRTPGRTRVICHTTLSFNPLNQFPQSQCECYASLKSFLLYSVPFRLTVTVTHTSTFRIPACLYTQSIVHFI